MATAGAPITYTLIVSNVGDGDPRTWTSLTRSQPERPT